MNALLLLCLVPVVLADSFPFHPKECCTTRQWSAHVYENGGEYLNGQPQALDYSTKMYVDYDAKRLRMDRDGLGPDGNADKNTIFFDYRMHKLYYVKAGHCYPGHLDSQMVDPCLHNATYAGRRVIGSAGSNINLNVWLLTADGNNVTLAMTDDCVPVYEVITTLNMTAPAQRMLTFGNYTNGVPDGIFNRPSSCPMS